MAVEDALPDHPLLVQTVENLPEKADIIDNAAPVTVAEPDGGLPQVVGFVMESKGETIGWYALAFDGDEQTWVTVHEAQYDDAGVPVERFREAQAAVEAFWEEQGGEFETEEVYEESELAVEDRVLNFE